MTRLTSPPANSNLKIIHPCNSINRVEVPKLVPLVVLQKHALLVLSIQSFNMTRLLPFQPKSFFSQLQKLGQDTLLVFPIRGLHNLLLRATLTSTSRAHQARKSARKRNSKHRKTSTDYRSAGLNGTPHGRKESPVALVRRLGGCIEGFDTQNGRDTDAKPLR